MIDWTWARARSCGLRDAQNIIVGTTIKQLRWWRGIPLIGLRQARMVMKMKRIGQYILDQINELATSARKRSEMNTPSIDWQENLAIWRLWNEIKKCLVFDDDYRPATTLNIEASARKWFYYRRTDPPYFRDHWLEYNDLAYKYLYPLFRVFPEIMRAWAEEYKKIDTKPGSDEAKQRPYVLFEEAFQVEDTHGDKKKSEGDHGN